MVIMTSFHIIQSIYFPYFDYDLPTLESEKIAAKEWVIWRFPKFMNL